ncbi:hypothetical protein CYMTET_22492 [Cymbomonas tetramitiformis]|uniref:Uncharacterized protein n=1 Tax=Cymbomonas tetramitiformis TaxID=36881 RepID=A0AAE0L1V3_9CHLO|nr:hypothetical protein CYMTET_22492 [Cymbomonas tetramitiformis]
MVVAVGYGIVLAASALLEFYAGFSLLLNTEKFIMGLYPDLEDQINPMVVKYGITSGIGLTSIGLLSLVPFMDEDCTRSVFMVLTYYNVLATANNYKIAGLTPPTVIHAALLIGCLLCTILTFVI